MTTKTILQLKTLMFVLLFVGCATVQEAPTTGFLTDYSNLADVEKEEGLKIETSSSLQLSDYSQFMIAPVVVYLHEDSKSEGIDVTTLNELIDYFNNKLKEEIGEEYTIVDEPSEGVAILRAAVTDFLPNKVLLNIHWATTSLGHGIGGASLEAEFVDAKTNKRIFAIKDTRKGDKFFQGMKDADNKVTNAARNYKRGLSKWGQTKNVFDEWSRMLVKYISEDIE